MDVNSIMLDSGLANLDIRVNNTGKADFQKVLDKATGKEFADEIENNHDVTLNIGSVKSVSAILDANDYSSKNIVCISQETLSRAEKNPALKKKILSAIENFCSPEERSKVDALQPPVKSAGMIIYPNGNVLYWLEGYPNSFDNNKEKRKVITESNNSNLMNQYIQGYAENTVSYNEQAMSVLASTFIK